MFYGRMREYPLYELQTVDDGYGFSKEQFVDKGKITAYIVRTDFTRYQSNDMDLSNYQYTGYTDSQIEIGSKVGNMRVTEVVPHRNGYYFYLATIGEVGAE